jgi:hypothetical protein
MLGGVCCAKVEGDIIDQLIARQQAVICPPHKVSREPSHRISRPEARSASSISQLSILNCCVSHHDSQYGAEISGSASSPPCSPPTALPRGWERLQHSAEDTITGQLDELPLSALSHKVPADAVGAASRESIRHLDMAYRGGCSSPLPADVWHKAASARMPLRSTILTCCVSRNESI